MKTHFVVTSTKGLARALQVTENSLFRGLMAGTIPAPDAIGIMTHSPRLWTLDSIRRWRPEVADRLEGMNK